LAQASLCGSRNLFYASTNGWPARAS